ncbi:MAG TPA: hypothetical protein PKA28_06065 [Methylomusa anaerophila]|uniref:Uncharacterized protein n=1 Tax=Methylomusa anaerophila TaxID=1930071 RepID=A0A348ALP1_9FIRM|nr:hypothetical protein [Methylomusa anaerophila]BBB91989.1 hypothetical protein MAMMFC1_02674 [Methylomusa anaerophila]HML87998.1 hypothetical protein [Methylomusa anaerophila]
MSERMNLQDVLREHGVPLITLNVTASEAESLKLRERLMAIRDLSQGKEQGYLEVSCTFYIDVHDIDRYLAGELADLAAIYAFPEDVKTYREE